LKINIKLLAGLFRATGMLQSLALLYAEYAVARKIKYDKRFSDFAEKSPRRSRTMYSNRLLGVVRNACALLRASS